MVSSSQTLKISVCLQALVLAPKALASSCDNPLFDTVNATASVSVAGFVYNETDPSPQNNTLHISTAITEQSIPSANETQVLQTFWLDSDPVIETNLTDLPYWGCMISLEGFEDQSTTTNASDLYGCGNILSSDCVRLIKYWAQEAIVLKSRYITDVNDACSAIIDTISNPFPSQCKKSERWTANHSVPIFGNLNNVDAGCQTSAFNASASQGPALTIESGFSKTGNFTDYDNFVSRTTPVILTAFSKDISKGYWVDTRLVCLQANTTVEAGSRVPTSGASRLTWSPAVLMSVIGLVTLLGI